VEIDPDRPSARPNVTEDALEAAVRLARAMIAREGSLPSGVPTELPAELRLGPLARPFEEVVSALDQVLAMTPSSASPRFFNQLFAGRDPAAVMAEMLVPLTNTSMYTLKVAGVQVLVEREVLSRMGAAAGFPDGEGMLSPGGSLSNMTAMLVARNEAIQDVRENGLAGTRLRVYTSELGHYSTIKNAGMLGIGRANVCEIPADGSGHMQVDLLDRLVAEDIRCGVVPVMINATAGTTVLGSFDPIRRIAEVAAKHGVWLHVDGALGASVLLSTHHRELMDGLEFADSLTWNAHKMMCVPLICSAIFFRRGGLLERHVGEQADYLFQSHEDELNPGMRSIQCGRRNDALKLWTAWLHHGDSGFEARIDRLFALARHAASVIESDPELELAMEPESVNVCFEAVNRSSAEICDRLDREGRLKIGHGVANGRRSIRLVCLDPDLDEERIEAVLDEIKTVARNLPKEDNAIEDDL